MAQTDTETTPEIEITGCGNGDDISCLNGGTCKDGPKLYNELGFPNFNFLTQELRNMHCSCPNEPAFPDHKGLTGIHCQIPYEMCPMPVTGSGTGSGSGSGQTFCFNGGTCERAQFNNDQYHCACPQDPRDTVWAGLNCIVEATDFCEEDGFFDVTGGKWFCTHGGTCVNGET